MYKVHKVTRLHWNEPKCKQKQVKFSNDYTENWSKVTCKKCLKFKKVS